MGSSFFCLMLKIKFEFHIHIYRNSSLPSAPCRTTVVSSEENSSSDKPLWLKKFAESQISHAFRKGSYSTARNYRTAIYSFLDFLQEKDVLLNHISSTLMSEYEHWLKLRGIAMGTISCYMRSLRAIYNKAVESVGITDKQPFKRCYTGYPKTDKRAISITDIRRLRELHLPSGRYICLVRDIFLFCLFACGMPFVDVAFLRKSQISDGYLTYSRRKTNQQIRVQLPPCAMEIVNRYHCSGSPYLFPILTTEIPEEAYRQYKIKLCQYNRMLKELARRADISVNLSSYVSRHSWASLTYEQNTEVSVISKGLGHTSPNTTMIYIKGIDDRRLDEANRRLANLIINHKGSVS